MQNDKEPKKLSQDAKELIRGYMLRLVALPGAILALVSFTAGFFIDTALETAKENAAIEAYKDAIESSSARYEKFEDRIFTIATDAEKALMAANAATREADKSSEQASISAKEAEVAARNAAEAKERANATFIQAKKSIDASNEALAIAEESVKKFAEKPALELLGDEGFKQSISDAVASLVSKELSEIQAKLKHLELDGDTFVFRKPILVEAGLVSKELSEIQAKLKHLELDGDTFVFRKPILVEAGPDEGIKVIDDIYQTHIRPALTQIEHLVSVPEVRSSISLSLAQPQSPFVRVTRESPQASSFLRSDELGLVYGKRNTKLQFAQGLGRLYFDSPGGGSYIGVRSNGTLTARDPNRNSGKAAPLSY